MFQNKKILILGATGLIGSALLRRISSENPAIILTPPRSELNLVEQANVHNYFTREKPDIVFLAAGRVGGIAANERDRFEFLYENMQIQNNVIVSAFQAHVEKLVFYASSCVYPAVCPQPIEEESLMAGKPHPTNESNSIAKISGLKLIETLRTQYQKNFFTLIPPTVYGPNDNFHPTDSHVIPGLIARMLAAKKAGDNEFNVWGTGNAVRDFLYVDDLVNASIHLLVNADPDWPAFFNLAAKQTYTIAEIARIIAEELSFSGNLVFDQAQPEGVLKKTLDGKKFFAYGWRAEVPLRNGIKKTINYLLSNKN